MNSNFCWDCLKLSPDNKSIYIYSTIKENHIRIDLENIKIIDHTSNPFVDEYGETLVEYRTICSCCKKHTRTKIIYEMNDLVVNDLTEQLNFNKDDYINNLVGYNTNCNDIPLIENYLLIFY